MAQTAADILVEVFQEWGVDTVIRAHSEGAMNKDPAADVVQRKALGFDPTAAGMGPILEAIGDSPLVLIGEATHGTHEFYRTRAELTRALISRTRASMLWRRKPTGPMRTA